MTILEPHVAQNQSNCYSVVQHRYDSNTAYCLVVVKSLLTSKYLKLGTDREK